MLSEIWGSIMRTGVRPNVQQCYEKARQAEHRAAQERDNPDRERFWLDANKQWLALAASSEYQARLSKFINELRSLLKRSA